MRPFYLLVPGGLQYTKDLYLEDQLVVEADHRFSLKGSLLMIMSHLCLLFIHLFLKIIKHLDESVLGSIVPYHRGSRRGR